MMRAVAVVSALAALASTGCTTTYSSIRKVDDNTYMVTRTKQGFFVTFGTVYSCVTVGENLKCTEVDSL